MNSWCVGLIATGLTVLLLYVLAPGAFLQLGLLLYPKGHKKRAEFLGEHRYVPRRKRPGWVAGQLLHCLFEGPPARLEWRQQARREREIATRKRYEQLLALAQRRIRVTRVPEDTSSRLSVGDWVKSLRNENGVVCEYTVNYHVIDLESPANIAGRAFWRSQKNDQSGC